MEWFDEHVGKQLGLITQEDLDKRVSRRQGRRLVENRRLIPVFRGVYRAAGTPVTWEQTQLAGQLSLGDRYASAFRSAARLQGVVDASRHHYVGETRHPARVRGLVVHSSTLIPADHVVMLGPHRVTTVARTLFDLSAVLGHVRWGQVLDEAVRNRLVTYQQVDDVRDDLRRRGRRRTTVVDTMLDDRLGGPGPGDSDLVATALRWIRAARLPQPETEVRVTTAGGDYRLDIAWRDRKVAVECHGWRDHGKRSRFSPDWERATALQLAGWIVVYMTSDTTRAAFLADLRSAHQARP